MNDYAPTSRFGKYMQLQFDFGGSVVGGKVTNFLLEKSRVVHHSPTERSFHVFYQLLRRSSEGRGASSYAFLMNEEKVVDGVDDAKEGAAVAAAMAAVGISEDDRTTIDRVLTGILCLGNVEFRMDDDNGTHVSGGRL